MVLRAGQNSQNEFMKWSARAQRCLWKILWLHSLRRPSGLERWSAQSSIHVAAILGDDSTVRRFIALDPTNATLKAAPFNGDALVYLCLSKYLQRYKSRSAGFLRATTALLDAGANPNTGFMSTGDYPDFETALYGAAAVAHHAELTRLLLQRGGDPNDAETPYHSPESYDNAALHVLVESGKLTPDSLTTMLLRKADVHDYEGIKY